MTSHPTTFSVFSVFAAPRAFFGVGLIAVIGLVALGALAARGIPRRQPKN